MARTYSDAYKKRANTLSAHEPALTLLEITHSALTEAVRVVDDNDDFPYSDSLGFQATHAYALNEIVVPTQYNGRYYKVTVAGTSGGAEPTWPTVLTNTVVSGGVTFRCEGIQYKAVAFDVTMPDDQSNQMPRAKLSIDGVGQELAPWIEASNGGQGSQVHMMEVLRSNPTVIEWEITLDLMNINLIARRVSGEIGFENIMARNAVSVTYRPDVAPGLF